MAPVSTLPLHKRDAIQPVYAAPRNDVAFTHSKTRTLGVRSEQPLGHMISCERILTVMSVHWRGIV